MHIQHIHNINFNIFSPNCQGFFAIFMKKSEIILTKSYIYDILYTVISAEKPM